jgi:hypothetical protein
MNETEIIALTSNNHPSHLNGRPTRITDIAKAAKAMAVNQGMSAHEASLIYVHALRAASAQGFSTANFGR